MSKCIGVLRHMQRYFSYIRDSTDVQADWRRSWTYGRTSNAIDISKGSLTCPSKHRHGVTLFILLKILKKFKKKKKAISYCEKSPHFVVFYDIPGLKVITNTNLAQFIGGSNDLITFDTDSQIRICNNDVYRLNKRMTLITMV